MKIQHKAFTMLEVVLVIAIIAIMGVISYSALTSYQVTTVLDSELKILVSNIQSARQSAIGNSTGSSYSIKFLNDSFVVFPGTTYSASNPNNKEYLLDSLVVVSTTFGNDIVIFNSYDGRVSNPGSITLSAGGINKQLTINALGIVEDID